MTKAKARARAKARLAAKATRPDTKAEKRAVKERMDRDDPRSEIMRKSVGAERAKSNAAIRRGAARSR
jgi:hypothetical protein